MFSPDANIQGSLSIRNPRRRHRTSDDSITTRQTTKRRKRSSLAPETFESPSTSKANGNHLETNGAAKESTPEQRQRDVSGETSHSGLVTKSKGTKRGDKRFRRDDGAIQARTDHYVVEKDYNIPSALADILRKETWRGAFSPNLGHAVAITNSQAIVWAYSSKATNLEPTKSHVINLPFSPSARKPRDPLPLASLVHDAGAGELALLVVMPNGKLVYWESVSGAGSNDIARQKKQGLQGSIGGMFSGEIVIDLTEAEPDGFILTTSAGRLIHVAVRDPQGRPNISFNYLRSNSNAGVGFLESFKNVFISSDSKRAISAVRPGPLRGKNTRQCLIANVQAQFQVWDLARHGTQHLEFEIDGKEEITQSIQKLDPAMDTNTFELRLLDFTFFPSSRSKGSSLHKMLVSIAMVGPTKTHYFLVDMSLKKESIEVNVIYPVTCWYGSSREEQDRSLFKPRLLLPAPAHTAFLVFENFLLLVSLGKVDESPGSQLQRESNLLSEPYQDILFVNVADKHQFVGCAPGQESDDATCFLLASNFGLARATAFPTSENVRVDQRRAAMCRSRIELAVSFGQGQNNLFDLGRGLSAVDWEVSEIETATREINDSIINNQYSHISKMMPNMGDQLKQRGSVLTDLIQCVGKYSISHSLRWYLLWSAEKIHAARFVWANYDDAVRNKGPHDVILLPELIDMIHEDHKHENQPDRGETDIVRHFLTHDVARLDMLLIWAHRSLEELYKEREGRTPYTTIQQAMLTRQANKLVSATLYHAFDFMKVHGALYGLKYEDVESGIYTGDYSVVPQAFWTSTAQVVEQVRQLALTSLEVTVQTLSSSDDDETPQAQFELDMTTENVPLVELCCKVYDERIRYLKSRSKEKSRAEGEQLEKSFSLIRKQLIAGLQDLGLVDCAFGIGELYDDMEALADVLGKFETECIDEKQRPDIDEQDLSMVKQRIGENITRLDRYFKKFGARWSKAWYERKLHSGEFSGLLFEDPQHHQHLTQYLRDQPDLNNFTWVLEVSQGNYNKATDQLLQTNRSDGSLWSRKIESSMAKLALLAAAEKDQASETSVVKSSTVADKTLKIIEIQEELHAYLQPLLSQAIDQEAGLTLAMDQHGIMVTKTAVLESVLKTHLSDVIHMKPLDSDALVETLTLIHNRRSSEVDSEALSFEARRFYLALKLLDYSNSDTETRALDLKLLWRRCFLQDDWATLNRTEKSDEETHERLTENTLLFQTLRLGFKDGIFEVSQPLPPSEVVGAGCDVESLRESSRFAALKVGLLKKLALDNAGEDKALAETMEKGRLEDWWSGIVDHARKSIRKEADQAGQELAGREVWRQEVKNALGGRSTADGDADGDVTMS